MPAAKKSEPPTINVWIVKRGEEILATTPDEMWAKAFAAVNERKLAGVTIEFGPLEPAQILFLRGRRGRVDSGTNGDGIRTADRK